MTYSDKQITCSDCGTAFTFSAGEQESFASRGYTNEPKRCPTCRAARKQSTSGNSSFGSGGSGNRNYSSARGKCSRRNAPPVVKTRKYLLNLVRVGPSTVQIVTAKQIRPKDISYRATTMNGESHPAG